MATTTPPRPVPGGAPHLNTVSAVARPATMASSVATRLWSLRIPIQIRHTSLPPSAPAYITSIPRFSYLAQLIPKLALFFKLPCSAFKFEGIELRALCAGLLVDLYAPELPWRLEVVDTGAWDIRDTFLNSVKEADFVRNGNARLIMGMGIEDTNGLWQAVVDNDYEAYSIINNKLLHPPTPVKNIPVRLYIPTTQPNKNGYPIAPGSYKVMQSLVSLGSGASSREDSLRRPGPSSAGPKLLGAALKSMVPALFPSSRAPVLASVVMHGAAVPFSAPLDEIMREAAYPDGWLCLVVVLL